MKTTVTAANPYAHDRYGYLWAELAKGPPGRHLDYGAYDGAIISKLAETGVIAEGVGVDANADVVATHQSSTLPGVVLETIAPNSALPFASETFDSASLLDVLEHVVDQDGLLKELRRTLRPGAKLIVTTPRQYPLSFLDTGNWKFRFKRLHRLAVTRRTARSTTSNAMWTAKTDFSETSRSASRGTSTSQSKGSLRCWAATVSSWSAPTDRRSSVG